MTDFIPITCSECNGPMATIGPDPWVCELGGDGKMSRASVDKYRAQLRGQGVGLPASWQDARAWCSTACQRRAG